MNITEVKTRPANSSNSTLVAIASITIDDELIINDIRLYYSDGVYHIDFPNAASEFSKSNIVPTSATRHQIKTMIIQQWLLNNKKGVKYYEK